MTTKQLILPILSREGVTPKPFEDLLSAIVGLLRAYGYSDQYAIEINNGWHPVSEKPTENGWYLCADKYGYIATEFIDLRASGIPWYSFWQPLPEPPETKEDNDNV